MSNHDLDPLEGLDDDIVEAVAQIARRLAQLEHTVGRMKRRFDNEYGDDDDADADDDYN
jgi:hypothetical protein